MESEAHQDVYDEIYAKFCEGNANQDGLLFLSRRPDPEVISFLHWIHSRSSRGRALDIGCGAGRHCVALANAGYCVTGVDRSRVAIYYARQYMNKVGLEGEFILGDFPFYNIRGRFALALDVGCFHHTKPDVWDRYVKRLWRMLKPNAYVFLYQYRLPVVPHVNNTTVTHGGRHFSYFFRAGELGKIFSGFDIEVEKEVTSQGRNFWVLYLRKTG